MSAIIGWAMFHVQTNPLLDTAFINLNGLIGLIFASYVFGSIQDDKNKAKAAAPGQQANPDPSAPNDGIPQ
ncbi:hypothetical protein G6L78_01495 [Agrobacterium rhizogenes]|nr:hypothetical protein [Rhizobium rhizogenes]